MNQKTKTLPERVLEHFAVLRIPITAQELDRIIDAAEREGLSLLNAIDRLLGEQAAQRRDRSIKRRITLAHFAEHKTLDTFDWRFNKTIKRAQSWVNLLGANSSTNIQDALEQAFRFAGRGTTDRYYPSAIDTVFLLTDGTPTNTDGTRAETEPILEAVRRLNPHRRVDIHCVGIGGKLNIAFLHDLSSQNGGKFVQR